MHPSPHKSRKLLVASLGVATMTYVATTTLLPACGGTTKGSAFGAGDSGESSDVTVMDESPVGNLMGPQIDAPDDTPTDSLQIDDFPVANLAVMPDAGMPEGAPSEASLSDVTGGG